MRVGVDLHGDMTAHFSNSGITAVELMYRIITTLFTSIGGNIKHRSGVCLFIVCMSRIVLCKR